MFPNKRCVFLRRTDDFNSRLLFGILFTFRRFMDVVKIETRSQNKIQFDMKINYAFSHKEWGNFINGKPKLNVGPMIAQINDVKTSVSCCVCMGGWGTTQGQDEIVRNAMKLELQRNIFGRFLVFQAASIDLYIFIRLYSIKDMANNEYNSARPVFE